MSGRIRLYRDLQQHHIRLEEPFSRGQAWVDLLMFASHEGGSFRVRGNKVIVKRGEFAIAETTLAMRRKRSREKVRKFLNELESDGMIRQQKNRICSKYIILNYDKYQTTDYTTEQTTEKQQTRQQKNILKNVKNVEEGKEINKGSIRKKKAGQIITYSEKFLEFRDASPKTGDKSKAFESYELVIEAGIDADILKSKIAEYKEQQIYKNGNAKKYTKHVSTWLNNQGRENEYDTGPEYFTDEHFQRYVKNCVGKDTYYCPFDKKEYKCQISSYSYAGWIAKRTGEDIDELEKKAERPYDNFTNPDRI